MATEEKCVICDRLLGGSNTSKHHVVPKSRKGKDTVVLHNICHEKLHRTFTNKELERNTLEKLREHPEIVKFAAWVAKKPPDFYSGSDDSAQRRGKRR